MNEEKPRVAMTPTMGSPFESSPFESSHSESPPSGNPPAGSSRRAAREAAKARVRMPLPIERASHGMIVHRVVVKARDVVFVKGILEASDGVAAVFAEAGGELAIVAPPSRERELREILTDLVIDVGCVERHTQLEQHQPGEAGRGSGSSVGWDGV